MTHAGDDSGRLFVVEKGGTVRILQDGASLPAPFLDITDRVGNYGEAGLLGLAFPPDYASTGYFYVSYNHRDPNLVPAPAGEPNDGYDTVIARFQVTGDPNRADPASEARVLLRNQPYANHNGGLIAFGPDGYLYIGLDDGGSGGDPLNSGQRTDTILGKLLRIAVAATGAYTIPVDNPFVSTPNVPPEIWDLGLRNPWRWSFDRATGDLFIGDVGQNQYEEIDRHPAGQPGGLNFGWRCREGLHAYNDFPPCPGPLTDPIAEYDHSQGVSVTGGYVYRGAAAPQWHGRYFYGDFGSGRIWSIRVTGSGWSTPVEEMDSTLAIASFGEDQAGEIYVVDIGGAIYRLVATAAPPVLAGAKQASLSAAAPGQLVRYTVQLANSGAPAPSLLLTDVLPAGLTYVPDSFTAATGTADDSAAPQLRWVGALATGGVSSLAYEAIVAPAAQATLYNTAQVRSGAASLALTATVIVTTAVNGGDPDFFLPGSQPHSLVDPIADPAGCQGCHTAPIYGAWRGSLMSQAGRDPLLWAALAVANVDEPNAGEYCLRCHTPRGWFAGHSHPADGAALRNDELAAGVACATCHRMVDPAPVIPAVDVAAARDVALRAAISPTVPGDHVGSAMIILDPVDNRRGPFTINPAPPHPRSTWQTEFLGQGGDPVVAARVCGSCHNVDNPTLSWDPVRGQYWPNAPDTPAPSFAAGDLFPVERTYDEWLHSAYATAQGVYAPQFAGSKPDGIVRTCQDCHMPRAIGTAAYGDVQRDCQTNGCLPTHTLMGANTWTPQLLQDNRWRLNAAADASALDAATMAARALLQKAATVTVTLAVSGAQQIAVVRVINETGHKLPTGYAEGRRMWLTVRAFDAAGQEVFASGVYSPATGVLDVDPWLKTYEVKQGLTPELASELGLPAGESFHFVLNNMVVKDNRVPPRGYTIAAYAQPGLQPVSASYGDGQHWDDTIYPLPDTAVTVTATLYYQTASKEYIDFLRAQGGIDGATLGQLWDDRKSPPEVVAESSGVFP